MKLLPILIATDNILANGMTSDGEWFFRVTGDTFRFGRLNQDEEIQEHHVYLVDPKATPAPGDRVIPKTLVCDGHTVFKEGFAPSSFWKVLADVGGGIGVPPLSTRAIKLIISRFRIYGVLPNEVYTMGADKITLNSEGAVDIWLREPKEYTADQVMHLIRRSYSELHSKDQVEDWLKKNL